MKTFSSVDDYISQLSPEVQPTLVKMRQLIKKLVPEAEESIAYQMPAYKFKGKPLAYFSGWKDHVGFYPTPSGMVPFEAEVKQYRTGKGTLQFPLDKPVPYDLVTKVVKHRMQEILGGKAKNDYKKSND